MNITFLIGNGFDLNLGLETKYSDFVKVYKKTKSKSATIENFKAYIKDNLELWSDAEVAMGGYTSQFGEGEGTAFAECHKDFCEELSRYLKRLQDKVNFDEVKNRVLNAFSHLNNFENNFPEQKKKAIKNIKLKDERALTIFNIICFNYTYSIDECVSIVRNSSHILGKKNIANVSYSNKIGELCHVHGTVDWKMIFGVNDESQIKKPEIFNFEDGDIDKQMLVKVQANELCLEDRDSIAKNLITNSRVIYVYGMSIGETDKIWWERICYWLSLDSDRQLIVQKYGLIESEIIDAEYRKAERKIKKNILKYAPSEESKQRIEKQIHIDNKNIFLEINGIASSNPSSKDIIDKISDLDWARDILGENKN